MAGQNPEPAGAANGASGRTGSVRAVLDVRRLEPGEVPVVGSERRQQYEVELSAGSTVLEALMYVHEHVDGTLAFRRSCRHGICGACAMRIDGCARLACNTQLADVAEHARLRDEKRGRSVEGAPAVRIEPLTNMPVLKDLIVDMSVFWQKLSAVQPWLQTLAEADPDHERLVSPDDHTVMAEALLCVECGACYSDCPAVTASPEFIGPTALAKAYRYAYDPRDDRAHRRLYDLGSEHGQWECTRCYTCTQRCPKHLKVRQLISRLGELACYEGLRADPAVRRADSFADSITATGLLDERRLPFATEGAAAVKHAPEMVRALRSGKTGLSQRAPIDDLDLVRRVLDRLGQETGGPA